MLLVLIVLSCVASIIDARARRIPNGISLAIALLGCLYQVVRLSPGFAPALFTYLQYLPVLYHISFVLPSAVQCLLVAAVLLVVGVALELLVRKISGKAGMGLGDIKYIAAWSCWLGWFVLPAVGLACLLGAAYALWAHERTFALGPWLSFGFVVVLFMLLFTLTPNVLA